MKNTLFFTVVMAVLMISQAGAMATPKLETHTLRIVSYNIRHGAGVDGKVNLERTAAVIAKLQPDLVALQEVDIDVPRSGNLDITERLGELLGMESRFAAFMEYKGGEYGLGILSKLPITETAKYPLPAGSEPRTALEATVLLPGSDVPVAFISIHNSRAGASIHETQTQALLDALDTEAQPMILAGDFNAIRSSPALELLRQDGWQVLHKQGAHKTYPADQPEKEIDFIALRGLKLESVEHYVVEESMASDHRPIFAEITFAIPGDKRSGGEAMR